MNKTKIDIPFFVSVVILVVVGFLIFSSASLGLLPRNAVKYSNVAFNQTFYGLILGLIACFVTSKIDYKLYRKYSLYIFIAAVIITACVFIPGIGVYHGGAHRWIRFGTFSMQPSEILKIGYIIFLAAWLSKVKDKAQSIKYGLVPFGILSAIVAALILTQPDTATFMVALFAGLAIYLTAGGKWKYIFMIGAISVLGIAVMSFTRPYVMSRITTFINPAQNTLGSGYQIQQSMIAIGSGGVTGRGFGQSIQKFSFLPEPIGDSIFAVYSEEFGFLGGIVLIALYIFFAFRGLKIAGRVPDSFGRLVVVGIVILITSQAFINISSMVGVIPLSGVPLPFVSHGGTALFVNLLEIGIILNISKSAKKT